MHPLDVLLQGGYVVELPSARCNCATVAALLLLFVTLTDIIIIIGIIGLLGRVNVVNCLCGQIFRPASDIGLIGEVCRLFLRVNRLQSLSSAYCVHSLELIGLDIRLLVVVLGLARVGDV